MMPGMTSSNDTTSLLGVLGGSSSGFGGRMSTSRSSPRSRSGCPRLAFRLCPNRPISAASRARVASRRATLSARRAPEFLSPKQRPTIFTSRKGSRRAVVGYQTVVQFRGAASNDESYDEVSYSSSLSHYVYHPPPRPLRPRRVPSPFVLPSPLASLRDDPHREFRRRLRAFRPGVSTPSASSGAVGAPRRGSAPSRT